MQQQIQRVAVAGSSRRRERERDGNPSIIDKVVQINWQEYKDLCQAVNAAY